MLDSRESLAMRCVRLTARLTTWMLQEQLFISYHTSVQISCIRMVLCTQNLCNEFFVRRNFLPCLDIVDPNFSNSIKFWVGAAELFRLLLQFRKYVDLSSLSVETMRRTSRNVT